MGRNNHGFSLIEVLVATSITIGVGAIVFQLFHQNERIYRDESVLMEMQQTARMVVSQIEEDIRIAGESVPPAVGDIVLPGSSAQRLNLRAGFSTTESIVTTALPISAALGSAITVKVESTAGFSAGKQIFVWDASTWLRATVNSVSGSAKTVRLTPAGGSTAPLQFTTPPVIGLDEAIAVYRDAATNTVRHTTSSNTTNTDSPAWAPANEIAANVIGLDFLYYDSAGVLVTPDTPVNRSRIAAIEARVRVRPATPLSNLKSGAQPVFALSIRAIPRNLQPQ